MTCPETIRISFTFSLSIQSLIVFILPFIIFSFLFSCIGNLSSGALRFVLLLLPMICISNYIAVIAAYFSSYAVIEQFHFISVLKVYKGQDLLSPQSWVLQLAPLFANDKALVAGCVSGYSSSRFFPEKAKVYSAYMMRAELFTLKSVFVPVLPFLIFGFVLRMHTLMVC